MLLYVDIDVAVIQSDICCLKVGEVNSLYGISLFLEDRNDRRLKKLCVRSLGLIIDDPLSCRRWMSAAASVLSACVSWLSAACAAVVAAVSVFPHAARLKTVAPISTPAITFLIILSLLFFYLCCLNFPEIVFPRICNSCTRTTRITTVRIMSGVFIFS